MPDEKNNLFLYEALELRGEYDARMKDLRALLPENRTRRSGWLVGGESQESMVPAEDVDLSKLREKLQGLERKRVMLNSAIQQANYENRLTALGETMSLARALEERKATDKRIGELHERLVQSAFVKVIYKEDRDIVTPNNSSFTETRQELDEARISFRELNRRLREAAFKVTVDFKDE
jgi:hypothetical protein